MASERVAYFSSGNDINVKVVVKVLKSSNKKDREESQQIKINNDLAQTVFLKKS